MEIQIRIVDMELNPGQGFQKYIEISRDNGDITYITPDLFQVSTNDNITVKSITDPVIYVL